MSNSNKFRTDRFCHLVPIDHVDDSPTGQLSKYSKGKVRKKRQLIAAVFLFVLIVGVDWSLSRMIGPKVIQVTSPAAAEFLIPVTPTPHPIAK